MGKISSIKQTMPVILSFHMKRKSLHLMKNYDLANLDLTMRAINWIDLSCSTSRERKILNFQE